MKNQTARGLARSRTLPRHVVGFRHSPALIPGFTMLQGVVEEVSRSRELLKVSEGKVTLDKGWIIIFKSWWLSFNPFEKYARQIGIFLPR